MWLLKLHIAFSILCLLTFTGFKHVFKEQIFKNGYFNKLKKERLRNYCIFFVPLLNVLLVIVVLVMVCVPKDQLDRILQNDADN